MQTGYKRRRQTQSNYDERHFRGRHWFGWAIVILLLAAVIASTAALLTHMYPYSPMMPYYGYPLFGWWFFFPFGLIFIFILIFFVTRLAFWPWGWGGGWRRGYYRYGDAREILRQRYARGEISKDQYEQMMRDLEQHS